MKRPLAALLLLACLALTACGWHGSGVVTGKDRRNAYTTVTMMTVGKTIVPITHYWPADYWLHVRDSAGQSHDVDVTKADYEKAKAGDTFSNEEKK